ncbi:MAG: allophycocyanin subunit beta, partial [Trichodesmium sp. St2_bin2_1]|nr:allophycocyanin subunit beta [Trichodesmium sp. St2_bin2_1]
MRDTVTGLIANYDAKGRYFDQDGVERLKSYFETGTARVQAATLINSKAASLV